MECKEKDLSYSLAIRRENPKAEPDTPRKFFRFMAVKERKSKYPKDFEGNVAPETVKRQQLQDSKD